MSAARAIAAKAHVPVQAAPPAVQAIAPSALAAMAPMVSLTAIPSGPSVQRKCAACEEEQSAVQPRLEVGPVGDRYEQEADSIAAQVMAMRDSEPSAASDAAPAVQRACAACSASSDDEPRARRIGGEDRASEEDELKVRARREGGPETIAASDSELTSGGAALPAGTRSFFETRMGRDLGDVRVHQGGQSAAMNASISARAFTYKNHVWLGAGETAGPSFTMAHELAHVMQQTAPGPVGPQRVMRIKCDPDDKSLFFAPTTSKKSDAEQEFIAKLTKGTGLLGEAPVPNATKNADSCNALGKTGRADLMKTSNGNFVGFRFAQKTGKQIPRPWYSPSASTMGCPASDAMRLVPQYQQTHFEKPNMFVDGKAVPVGSAGNMAPTIGYTGGLQFTADGATAPTSVEIGEVKFGGTRSARKEAQGQIDHYLAGHQFVQKGYEDIRRNISISSNELEGGKKPNLTEWKLKTGYLTSIQGVSDDWQPQGESQDLVVAKYIEVKDTLVPKKCENIDSIKGKLYHGHDTDLKFVWLYAWYPDAAPPENTPDGKSKFTTYQQTAQQLLSKATSAPGADAKVRKMPIGASIAAPSAMRKSKPAKPIPSSDPFKEAYPEWKKERDKLGVDFKGYRKSNEFGKDTMGMLFNQALKNTKEIKGTSPNSVEPSKSAAMVEAEKGFRDLEIMAGPGGKAIGELRYRLGTVFLKILAGYDKIRTKVEGFFKKSPSGTGGSLGARALRIFTKILGKVALYMLPRVTDALIECVENGFRATIERWIDQSPVGTIEDTINSYIEKANALKDDVFGDVAAFVEETIAPLEAEYEAVKKIVDGVVKVVDIAKKIFDVARAAACLAGGLETLGISCVVALADKLLSLVGASPSEHLMGWLMESCAAKEYLAKVVLGYQQIKEIPRAIAKKIVELIGPRLPDWLQSFVCDPKTMTTIEAELPTWDEVACDGSEGGLGKSDRPGGVDASVDRTPTADEKEKLGGFDIAGNDADRPRLPAPPPVATTSPQQTVPPQPAAPTGGGDDASDEQTSDTRKHSVEPGTVQGGVNVAVNYVLRGGFTPGKFNPPKPSGAIVQAATSSGSIYGPDSIEILIHEVYMEDGKPRIKFSPKIDYKLNSDDRSLGMEAGVVYDGKIGAPQ